MKSRRLISWVVLFGWACFMPLLGYAQFYNGLQNDFGKNRIQFSQPDWQFYRFDKYELYFYANSKEITQYLAEVLPRTITELETQFEYALDDRLEFVVYPKLSDFRQSNIGLQTGGQANIGGNAQIVGSKVFLYYEDDHAHFEEQIRAGVAEAILNQWIYGSNWRQILRSSTLLHLPDWYFKGLVRYLSHPWNIQDENRLRDGVLSGKFKRFNSLEGEEAIFAGASIWRHIVATYGKDVVPNLVYLASVSRNVESGFTFILGTSIKGLIQDWYGQNLNRFSAQARQSDPLPKLAARPFPRRLNGPRMGRFRQSPDGKWLTYATHHLGRYRVYLVDRETGKRRVIHRGGRRLDRIQDYSYPLMAWHPASQRLAIVTEEKSEVVLRYYDLESKTMEVKPPLYAFEKVLDLSYAPDGKRFVMSAFSKGRTDLYLFTIGSNSAEALTQDVYDDLDPRFVRQGKGVVFSSNRNSDTLRPKGSAGTDFYQQDYDLYLMDLGKKGPTGITRLTQTPGIQERSVLPFDTSGIAFLGDYVGATNRWVGLLDSTLAYVDTTEHYRQRLFARPATRYSTNVLQHDLQTGSNGLMQSFWNRRRVRLTQETVVPTDWKAQVRSPLSIQTPKGGVNGLLQPSPVLNLPVLSFRVTGPSQEDIQMEKRKINIHNYPFEGSPSPVSAAPEVEPKKLGTLDTAAIKSESKAVESSGGGTFKLPKQLNYFRFFTLDQVVTQFNNNFINQTYQKYTGGAFFFNPGLTGMVQFGLSDVFENYRISGGFKLSADLRSNEFLLSYEDRSKRLDKQYTFYRQSFPTNNSDGTKVLSHLLSYALKYPFSEVSSWRNTLTVRSDRSVTLTADDASLRAPNTYEYWATLKTEYVFDNSREKAINIYNGFRAKAFAEYFNQLNESSKNLTVFGFDARYYQKIYRNLIFACRIAGSSSFGTQKLIYYLGSVDNWLNLSTRNPTFDRRVPVDPTQNYAFQALATNLRGFSQNIRNGNSFLVMNYELRFPVFTVLSNKPLRSDFLTNFQVVGFYDVGSAWKDVNPFKTDNTYTIQEVRAYPVTVTLQSRRQPIVSGYGFGLRSRLFGYFVRTDWAWGMDEGATTPRMFYLSLSTDF